MTKIFIVGAAVLVFAGLVGGAVIYLFGDQINIPRQPAQETVASQDLIRISSPRPNQVISSPLRITGEARGYWFFEASFPVRLFDGQGNEIPLDPPYIMATQEWMTEDFVPFEATVEFQTPGTGTGTLLFQKDNPSGLPENEDQLVMPIRFNE